MLEGALIVDVLHAVMIYCLPSMALLACLPFRLELRSDDSGELADFDVPSSRANTSAPVEIKFI
jgi:hypothetical protein